MTLVDVRTVVTSIVGSVKRVNSIVSSVVATVDVIGNVFFIKMTLIRTTVILRTIIAATMQMIVYVRLRVRIST